MNAEKNRLVESDAKIKDWKHWGPYVSERAWGTVREDYSPDGSAWTYFPHDHARSRAYRWNEDGLAGICDRSQELCFSIALWNRKDPILKERLFGLTGPQGNHGEDVKEIYYYLDSTPTHSYMKYLYKYPQAEFPYQDLIDVNAKRSKSESEYDIIDTGIFDDDRYFDVFVEYAKADAEDILIRITIANRGSDEAEIAVLPTMWFRNTWSWSGGASPSQLTATADNIIAAKCASLGQRWLYLDSPNELIFTENETNNEKLFNSKNRVPFVKDAFHRYIIEADHDAVNPAQVGTKASGVYHVTVPGGGDRQIRLRFCNDSKKRNAQAFDGFDDVFSARISEADDFYGDIAPTHLSADAKNIQRQAFAGMLWSKQFYHYIVKTWLEGDKAMPKPPDSRLNGRNSSWKYFYSSDVLSMPDKWEYPWFAAWDLAFHCIPIAVIDPTLAKRQLILLLREWYMHPSGQIPAYEWAFSDVNPPVHAWAALRVYQIERKATGKGDRTFLARIFQKLLLNFTWWVNRKDAEGNNIFEGGFLGLDNIGIFDRSQPLPVGGALAQADGTSWMAMYCLNMLAIALELSIEDDAYEDVASKFFEHFIYISDAMNKIGADDISLWDEEDGFYYDVIHLPESGYTMPIRIRSMVGLIPLFAVATIDPDLLKELPDFKRRMQWFIDNRPDLTSNINCARAPGVGERRLLAIANQDRLKRVLKIMLDETEFLSPHGVRALSQFHRSSPYILQINGTEHRVDYEPAESTTGFFGGNSNWRGPVWMPVNYLIIESLQKFHHFYGDDLKVEFPTGSGVKLNLWDVAEELSRRLSQLFLRGSDGRRPAYGDLEKFQSDPHFRDCLFFYEYFNGDTGAGLGACHQTGWTGLVAKLLLQSGE